MTVSYPATAARYAIPRPIVPVPMTAICRIAFRVIGAECIAADADTEITARRSRNQTTMPASARQAPPPHPPSAPSPPAEKRWGRRTLDEGNGKALEGTIQVKRKLLSLGVLGLGEIFVRVTPPKRARGFLTSRVRKRKLLSLGFLGLGEIFASRPRKELAA